MTKPERLWWPRYVGPAYRIIIFFGLNILISGLITQSFVIEGLYTQLVGLKIAIASFVLSTLLCFWWDCAARPDLYRFTNNKGVRHDQA